METLGKLFGSVNKVKLLRLFLLNPDLALTTKEIARRSKVSSAAALKELKLLAGINLISKKTKSGAAIWQLDRSFPNLSHLKQLVQGNVLAQRKELVRQFGRCGQIKFLAAAGVLIENNDSRTDLLVVGDHLKRGALDRIIKGLEAEIGRELTYAVLDTADFHYRLTASDKFVRDVLDYPHERLVDKLGV